jgi:hypothetical protein
VLTVLSLCDFTGVWCEPYRLAGYDVRQVDLQHGGDVRLFEALPHPVRGVLAAPPCTAFARAGADHWPVKDARGDLEAALAVVDACLRIVVVHRPQWWVLENPIGRLRRWLGEPVMRFDPCDYGDPYTKRTCLWGHFKPPTFRRVANTEGSKMHVMPDSLGRSARRSVTPEGFARAFFEANP